MKGKRKFERMRELESERKKEEREVFVKKKELWRI